MSDPVSERLAPIEAWFARRGWTPFAFQREAWRAWLQGESGLVTVPTGAGKTWAAFGGPLAWLAAEPGGGAGTGLRVLYLSPLRAVGRDVEGAIAGVARDLGLGLRVEARTGDTDGRTRARQRRQLPEVLVTTPESLALLLSWDDAPERLGRLDAVVLDEWHELIATKRGALLELSLARLSASERDAVEGFLALQTARSLVPAASSPLLLSGS